MGKYVIESKFENTRCFLEVACENREPYFFINRVDSLTPYTEPDLEQVKKEAFEEGKKQAKVQAELDVCHDIEKVAKENYQQGINDAWEAARKIWEYDTTTLRKIFGDGIMRMDWFMRFTASEAIEKIRQYEQEQEEFHVGDEFENESGKKFVVLKMNGKEIDRYIDVDGKTYLMSAKYKVMRKTGRYFPEIAAVLKKMREDGNQNRIQETMSDDY